MSTTSLHQVIVYTFCTRNISSKPKFELFLHTSEFHASLHNETIPINVFLLETTEAQM